MANCMIQHTINIRIKWEHCRIWRKSGLMHFLVCVYVYILFPTTRGNRKLGIWTGIPIAYKCCGIDLKRILCLVLKSFIVLTGIILCYDVSNKEHYIYLTEIHHQCSFSAWQVVCSLSLSKKKSCLFLYLC